MSTSSESDWAFLRAALPDLREYVLSGEVTWPLRSEESLSEAEFTLGSILLSVARLAALELPASQQWDLGVMAQQIQRVREMWQVNWGLKALQEFNYRSTLWHRYLHALQADRKASAPIYGQEVCQRAMLRLLVPEVVQGLPLDQEEQLGRLDAQLRTLTRPGPFLWESELQKGFPEEGFWFLYVKFNP